MLLTDLGVASCNAVELHRQLLARLSRCQALPGRDALLADLVADWTAVAQHRFCSSWSISQDWVKEQNQKLGVQPGLTPPPLQEPAECLSPVKLQPCFAKHIVHKACFEHLALSPPNLLRLAHLVFCSSEAVQASSSSGLKVETAAHRYFHGLKRHLHRATLPGHQDGPVPFLVLLSEVSASTEQVWSVWSARQLEVVRCAVCHSSSLWVFFCASVWLHRHRFSLGREAFVSKTPRVKMSCSTGASPSKAAVASLSHR